MGDFNIPIRETHIVGSSTRELIVSKTHCAAFASHGIVNAGLTQAGSDFRFVRERATIAQVLACVGGSGVVLDGENWRGLREGEAYVTPPYMLHAYHAIPNTPWRLAWILYEPLRSSIVQFAVAKPTIVTGNFRPLATAIENLYAEIMGESEQSIVNSWASLVHAYAQRSLVPRKRLDIVWDAVRGDLTRQWSVALMAGIANLSGEHLRRVSVEETGLSPMRMVTSLRMREAAALLSSESYKLPEVASRIGYDNVFAFSTAFKRHFGVAPATYRSHPHDNS